MTNRIARRHVKQTLIAAVFFLAAGVGAISPAASAHLPKKASPAHSRTKSHGTAHSSRAGKSVAAKRTTPANARALSSVRSAPARRAPVRPASSALGPQQAKLSAKAPGKKKTSTKKRHRSAREPFQKAPTPGRISEIQSALARDGYYQGAANGKWDANTVTAMEKFQSEHGLEPSGKLDALSLQKLGLGSDIAGVSAPRPAKPAGNTTPAPAPSATSNVATTRAQNAATPPDGSANAATNASATPAPKPPQRR
jgi:hypothetical protein